MTHQYALEKVAIEAPHATPLLLRLIASVEQENSLYYHHIDTPALFGIPRTTAEVHFSRLRELGAVVPDPKQETRTRGIVLWRICPFLVWKGTAEKLRDYIKALPASHPFLAWRDPE